MDGVQAERIAENITEEVGLTCPNCVRRSYADSSLGGVLPSGLHSIPCGNPHRNSRSILPSIPCGLPHSLYHFLAGQAISICLCHLDSLPTPLVRKQMPYLPAAGTRKQPQLAVTGPAPKKVQH